MNDFLEMKKLQDGCPVMVTCIPKLIMKEIDVWVKESKKFKDSPLAELKAHENVGYLAMEEERQLMVRNIIHISALSHRILLTNLFG